MRNNAFFTVVLAISLLVSFGIAAKRWRVEKSNRTVEIVLDYEAVASMARASGKTLPQALREFKAAGATSVALPDETLESLAASGDIALLSPQAFPVIPGGPQVVAGKYDSVVLTTDSDLALQIQNAFRAKAHALLEPLGQWRGRRLLGISGLSFAQKVIGVGVSRRKAAVCQEAGMASVGRPLSFPGATQDGVRFTIRDLKAHGVHLALFAADEVMGFKDQIPETAAALKDNGVPLALVEFAKQRGDQLLGKKLEGNLVRAHSINELEMVATRPPEAVDRFVRAVQERGIRVCFVRFFQQFKRSPMEDNAAYVAALAGSLRQSGFVMGPARPYGEFAPPAWTLPFATTGAVAGWVLLLSTVVPLTLGFRILLWGGATLAVSGLSFVSMEWGQKLAAFAACTAFPALGVIASRVDCRERENTRQRGALPQALRMFLRMTAISLCAAPLIVGALSSRNYMVVLDQFAGVKLSQLLPFAVIAAVLFGEWHHPGAATKEERWSRAREAYRRLLEAPLSVKYALLVVFGLVLGLLWIARTGNEPGVGVSDVELRVRALLEHLLVARPRTKEFLLGHPAMVLALVLALKGRPRYVLPLVLLGTIGQTSMVNTFCHIQTPLWLSLLRTVNGLWIGVLLGGVVAVAATRGKCGVSLEGS